MKISLRWLRKYVDCELSAEEVERVLPLIGHEVDSVESTGVRPLDKVVVGEIEACEQHPEADKLGVCTVNVGEEETLQIVCGASNYKVGDRVPVAMVGAKLPGDFKIKKSKLRGVASHGMLCSPTELGLTLEIDGLYILEDRPELGLPIHEALPEGDVVFDLELTANRGDCASHIGVARELAAYYGVALKLPEAYEFEPKGSDKPAVQVESENCPYYSAIKVKGVKIGDSPEWLKEDLLAVGLRPVNNVVDILNWLMFETGQPMHAFDAAKVDGGTLIVRQAKEGETIKTLDEGDHVLSGEDLVIADAKRPLVIAGIMGALDAEVDDSTKDIILEAAYFDPAAIRRTHRKFALHTDSAYRFARDVDPTQTLAIAHRAIGMILEIAGGVVDGDAYIYGEAPRGDVTIELEPDFIRKVFGFDIADDAIETTLVRLGFTVDSSDSVWKVLVPAFRSEVTRPIDLAEECLRIYGTDKIPASQVDTPGLLAEDHPIATFNHKAADFLVDRGFYECSHYSLRSSKELETFFDEGTLTSCAMDNPLTADHTHVRPSLIPGLLDGLLWNQYQGNPVERLFETGRVWRNGTEMISVAFALAEESSSKTWLSREEPDFQTAKNLWESVRALIPNAKKKPVQFERIEESMLWQTGHAADVEGWGSVGMLDLRKTKAMGIDSPILAGEILMDPIRLKKAEKTKRFEAFSHYPSVSKDIALVVDASLPAGTVEGQLREVAVEVLGKSFNLLGLKVFDVYEGKGLEGHQKSLAFNITFGAEDRTLKDSEVQKVFEGIQEKMLATFDYVIRS